MLAVSEESGTENEVLKALPILRVCDKEFVKVNAVVRYMDERDYEVATAGSSVLSSMMSMVASAMSIYHVVKL